MKIRINLLSIVAIVIILFAIGVIAGGVVSRGVEVFLQEALMENANLRRTIVELEEKQKVYSEVFECSEIRRRLGL